MMAFQTSRERWRPRLWPALVFAALLWTVEAADGPSIPMDYCASINTASTNANHSIWQSDGLCHDFCIPKFALAVVKGSSCWCSDFVPTKASQVSTNKCNDGCPGFPGDVCGGDGLFGYMALAKQPSGTTGGTTATPTTTIASTTPSKPPSTSSTTSSTTSSSPRTSTPTVSTVSSGGTVRTVTVVPTETPGPGDAANTGDSGSKKSLSTGAAVGIALAVVVAFLAVGGIVFFFWWKRRKERRADERAGYDAPSQRGSSSGMMGTPKTGEVSENRFVGGSDGRTMAESWENSTQGKRRSALMPVDPRMDASNNGIYNRAENKSHESLNTLRDDQDYSRRVHNAPRILRATNPDP